MTTGGIWVAVQRWTAGRGKGGPMIGPQAIIGDVVPPRERGNQLDHPQP